MASQTSPVLQPLPPHRDSHRPEAKEQDAVDTGKAKQQALSTFRSTHVPRLCYRCGISIPCWSSITSAAVPCSEHIFSVTETQHKVARKTEILFVLKYSTLLIKLQETHQNPKSKGMLCSFWQIIIISFIYKNQTAPKPQLHTQKKLMVVSKDYRN